MSARTWMTAAMLAVGAFVLRPAAPAVSARPAEVQDQTTTLDDQTELAVTVYNSDIALVRDVRRSPAGARHRPTCASWTSRRR